MFESSCPVDPHVKSRMSGLFTYALNPIQKGPSLLIVHPLYHTSFLPLLTSSPLTHTIPAAKNNYSNVRCLAASKNTAQQPQEPPAATTTATATTTTTTEAIRIHTTMPLMTTPALLIPTAMTPPS